MTTKQHLTGTDWKARLAEANDAIGAARDAMRQARGLSERRAAESDLTYWLQQRAHVEGWLAEEPASPEEQARLDCLEADGILRVVR